MVQKLGLVQAISKKNSRSLHSIDQVRVVSSLIISIIAKLEILPTSLSIPTQTRSLQKFLRRTTLSSIGDLTMNYISLYIFNTTLNYIYSKHYCKLVNIISKYK